MQGMIVGYNGPPPAPGPGHVWGLHRAGHGHQLLANMQGMIQSMIETYNVQGMFVGCGGQRDSMTQGIFESCSSRCTGYFSHGTVTPSLLGGSQRLESGSSRRRSRDAAVRLGERHDGGVCRRSGHIPVSRDADPGYLDAFSRIVRLGAHPSGGFDGDLRDVGAQGLDSRDAGLRRPQVSEHTTQQHVQEAMPRCFGRHHLGSARIWSRST